MSTIGRAERACVRRGTRVLRAKQERPGFGPPLGGFADVLRQSQTDREEKLVPSPSLKIVAIGAGSGFGRGVIAEVLGAPALRQRDCTLSLVDLDQAALDRMHRLALRIKDHHKSQVRVEAATDRKKALPGADYVITSVAIKRYPLWEQDFRIPLAYGFKHALGENGGPGAVFHALRNYELMIPICRDIEELCPDALLLNFTNPESRIIRAVSDLTKVRGRTVPWSRRLSGWSQRDPGPTAGGA